MKLTASLKQAIVFSIALLASSSLAAQYYYNDIIVNKQVLAERALLKEQKIKGVKVTSLESDGMESEGFVCQKKINRNYTAIEVYTQTDNAYPSVFTSYFTSDGLLEQTVDSSEASATTVVYSYDAPNRLSRIYSTTRFSEEDAHDVSEEHFYEYNAGGTPVKMLLIKNTLDTTEILFMPDEKKNVAIEKNSRTAEDYYYYYDGKNRLTDVVHSYHSQKNLFADLSFEYNYAGQVTKMVASEKEGAYFFTWRYAYDENGLRIDERCYSKEGKIMGSVEYKYK